MTRRRFVRLAKITGIAAMPLLGLVQAVEVAGHHENPNKEFGETADYALHGNTQFGWKTSSIKGAIHLNGHQLTMETGGGNRTVFSGPISGEGHLIWIGGGVPQVAPSILTGEKANTFTGPFTLARGILDLDKPPQTNAIPNDLVIGSTGPALVRILKTEQINDEAHVQLSGPGPSGIVLRGVSETIGSLSVETDATIDFGDQSSALVVKNGSNREWSLNKTLTINQFKPDLDRLRFGTGGASLPDAQRSRIGFENPRGFQNGVYTAKQLADGHLVPDQPVHPVSPPFNLSASANAARAALYSKDGLASLTASPSPLKQGTVISFFGDSITWQNGFIETIRKTLQESRTTKPSNIQLINRGINGGGVLALRDGSDRAAYPGNSPQQPFAECIANDRSHIAVIFIGINDVWWRKTAPEIFEKALRDLVEAARSNKTEPLLATLTVRGELPNGKNEDDPKIEQFAEITRQVAKTSNTTLIDLRSAYIAYLQNHNARIRVDGTVHSIPSGILTYDGVHPNATGIHLLANLISDGILRASQRPAKE